MAGRIAPAGAILPDFLADEPIARGALVSFLKEHEPPPAPVHVVRPPGARTPRKVAVLIDLLAQRFAASSGLKKN